MENVLIFRSALLSISETFILGQASGLRQFVPKYAGLHRTGKSLDIPEDALLLTSGQGRGSQLRIRLYRANGVAPIFHARIRKLRIALVHAHFSPDAVDALPIAKFIRKPMIVTLHGYDVTTSDKEFQQSGSGRAFLRGRVKLFKNVPLFLCVSQFLLERAALTGYPRDKLCVHYIGVDRLKFPFVDSERNKKLILFVGRLVEKKGCAFAIRAVAKLQREGVAADFVIIGDGPLRSSLESLAQELCCQCKFLGSQSQEVIGSWLKRAQIFCAPSITATSGDSEGLGIVFAEAQSTGTPVVSFHHGGIPEVVRHGVTGLLAKEGDWEQLSAYLERLLIDQSFWSSCSLRGAEWIEQAFDLHKQNEKLEALYRGIIDLASVTEL